MSQYLDRKPRPSLLWEALKTAALPIVCYDLLLLRPWPMMERAGGIVTQVFFFSMAILGVVAGFWLTPPGRWRGLNVFVAVALPLELYSLPVLFYRSQFLGLLSLAVAGVSLLAFYLLVVRERTPDRYQADKYRRKFRHCLSRTRHVLALSLSLVLVLLGVTMGADFGDPADAPSAARSPVGVIGDYPQELVDFQADHWGGLSRQEQLSRLQLVADLESSHLGLPAAPRVEIEPMEDAATRGAYTHQSKSIALNLAFVETGLGEECLETLLHECYHSYQWYLCEIYEEVPTAYRDLLLYSSVKRYRMEFANYVDDGSADYYYQLCEVEARKYAQDRLELYQEMFHSGQEMDEEDWYPEDW